jgi:hypothetical protein
MNIFLLLIAIGAIIQKCFFSSEIIHTFSSVEQSKSTTIETDLNTEII